MHKQTEELMKIGHQLRKQFKDIKRYGDLHRSEFMMLTEVAQFSSLSVGENGITVSHLAKTLNISNAAVSKMLRVLEEKGYILRTMHTKDRRVVFVTLTEKGHQEVLRSKRNMIQQMDKIVGDLGEEDANQLVTLTRKLYALLCSESGGEEGQAGRKDTDDS